jgi:hypothetical protein
MGVDQRVVQADAARRPHHRKDVLVVLHHDCDGIPLAQALFPEVVGQAISAGLQFGETHHGPGGMQDQRGLVRINMRSDLLYPPAKPTAAIAFS